MFWRGRLVYFKGKMRSSERKLTLLQNKMKMYQGLSPTVEDGMPFLKMADHLVFTVFTL